VLNIITPPHCLPQVTLQQLYLEQQALGGGSNSSNRAAAQVSRPTDPGAERQQQQQQQQQLIGGHHHHHHQQQQQQQPHQVQSGAADGRTSQRMSVRRAATVHGSGQLALLLYALSELGARPRGALLGRVCSFTQPVLHLLPPADLSLLAVALGRAAYAPHRYWRSSFLTAVDAAAAATIAACSDAGGAITATGGTGAAAGNAQLQQQQQQQPAQDAAVAAALSAPAAGSKERQDDTPVKPPLPPTLSSTDVTCLLTAMSSMNLQPGRQRVQRLVAAGLSQLDSMGLQQCIVLLLALTKLRVMPHPSNIAAIAAHAATLVAADEEAAAAAAAPSNQAGSAARPQHRRSAGGRNQRDDAAAAAAQQRRTQQPLSLCPPRRLCLFLWALSSAVALLPPTEAAALRRRLRPAAAAAAARAAAPSQLRRLQPLDLVQLVLGLQGLECRPGPAFASAHMAACEAVHARFTPSLWRQLLLAYAGIGMCPTPGLHALALAAAGTDAAPPAAALAATTASITTTITTAMGVADVPELAVVTASP
jgi:hypothetical protein